MGRYSSAESLRPDLAYGRQIMNTDVVKRQIMRHMYARPRPPYERFLEHIHSRGDVWMVPQREVASWWEARQSSEIVLTPAAGGAIGVSCELNRSVVEVDGAELKIPPFDIPAPAGARAPGACITFKCHARLERFALEVFGHFGYGHVKLAGAADRPDIPAEALDPVLDRLRDMALAHWNYKDEDVEAFRSLARGAHRARGLPELRIWPLPHYRGRPYRVCVSTRYDVDRAIVNMAAIHRLEEKYGMRSTVYVRPMGYFYGAREIRSYHQKHAGENEIALHAEFVATAREHFGDEFTSAKEEKRLLEEIIGQEVPGVCMHGGELYNNMTENTGPAIDAAGFKYETIYQNQYHLPLHLPNDGGVYRTLSIGRNFMDLRIDPTRDFGAEMSRRLMQRLAEAEAVGGVFLVVLHPMFFDVGHYFSYPQNVARIAAFIPVFFFKSARMHRKGIYSNVA